MSSKFKIKTVDDTEPIIENGDYINTFYFLVEGKAYYVLPQNNFKKYCMIIRG